jgi:hypothetical protein
MTACKWRFSVPVLMNPKVHCAPVLENHHFRLVMPRISIQLGGSIEIMGALKCA